MSIALSYLVLLLVAFYVIYKLRRAILKDKNAVVPLLILIPRKKEGTESIHSQKDIQLTNELYNRLLEFKIWFAIEVVVENIGEEIKFFIFINRSNENRVRQLIKSLWPNSDAPEVDYYDLFSSVGTGSTAVSYLAQVKPYLTPLTTDSNVFIRILQCLSELSTVAESAAIQWIVKPAHSQIKYDISSQITQLQNNKIPNEQINQHFHLTKENVKALEAKVSQHLAQANCKLAVHTASNARTVQDIQKIASIFQNSHSSLQFNQVELKPFKNQESAIEQFLQHKFVPELEMILNTTEIASLFHLPGQNTPNPKIQRHQ